MKVKEETIINIVIVDKFIIKRNHKTCVGS